MRIVSLPLIRIMLCSLLSQMLLFAPLKAQEKNQKLAAAMPRVFSSPWNTSPQANLRMILSLEDQTLWQGGVEIELPKGSKTYWRNPGGAGVPPIFDFSSAQNITTPEIFYPIPMRFEGGGAESYGYEGKVVFPFSFTATGTKPRVSLNLAFAVCEKLCIPMEAKFTIDPEINEISEDAARNSIGKSLSEARLALPKIQPLNSGNALDILSITRVSDATNGATIDAKKLTLTLRSRSQTRAPQLFADGDGFTEVIATKPLTAPPLSANSAHPSITEFTLTIEPEIGKGLESLKRLTLVLAEGTDAEEKSANQLRAIETQIMLADVK